VKGLNLFYYNKRNYVYLQNFNDMYRLYQVPIIIVNNFKIIRGWFDFFRNRKLLLNWVRVIRWGALGLNLSNFHKFYNKQISSQTFRYKSTPGMNFLNILSHVYDQTPHIFTVSAKLIGKQFRFSSLLKYNFKIIPVLNTQKYKHIVKLASLNTATNQTRSTNNRIIVSFILFSADYQNTVPSRFRLKVYQRYMDL